MAGPLLSVETLAKQVDDPDWVLFDVRHDLMDPDAGRAAYQQGHIPGAVHAHIDRDLSDRVGDGRRGRHPLPDAERFVEFLCRSGVSPGSHVVCYDDAGGMWAARLWWLLRDYGHTRVSVLDGGLQAWTRAGHALSKDVPAPKRGSFHGLPGQMPTLSSDHVPEIPTIIDARAAERFRGDLEPIDPAAGHIPGAVNLPFAGNLRDDGTFRSAEEMRHRFTQAGAIGGRETVVYCGSGVTAAHNVLAMELAGLPTPALYPGSWSEWCHPSAGRPVATGMA